MSNLISLQPRTVVGAKRHFSVVASQFNSAYVRGLIDHTAAELRLLAPDATTTLTEVPGSFEIPIVVRELALQNHAENLGRSVTDALQRIAITHGVPVINAVLTFDNEDQARARCLESEINRGTEAARAAVEISSVIWKLRNK